MERRRSRCCRFGRMSWRFLRLGCRQAHGLMLWYFALRHDVAGPRFRPSILARLSLL